MTKEAWFSIWFDGAEGEFWACIRVWIDEDGKLHAEVVEETTE